MKRIVFTIALSLFGLTTIGAAAEVLVSCKADFSALMEGGGTSFVHVQIVKKANNALEGIVNNQTANWDVKVKEYAVRDNLNLDADPAASNFNYNEAEKALLHISFLMREPECKRRSESRQFPPVGTLQDDVFAPIWT